MLAINQLYTATVHSLRSFKFLIGIEDIWYCLLWGLDIWPLDAYLYSLGPNQPQKPSAYYRITKHSFYFSGQSIFLLSDVWTCLANLFQASIWLVNIKLRNWFFFKALDTLFVNTWINCLWNYFVEWKYAARKCVFTIYMTVKNNDRKWYLHWPNFCVMRSESFIIQVRFSSLVLNIKL